MKKILYITFLVSLFLSINNFLYAESKIDKIKNKIKATESKLIDNIWGSRDCSQYSTKTLSGLADYKKCKQGLEPSEKSFFKSFKLKGNKSKKFDPNKPCDEYSTKTFTGLAAKIKCKSAEKN